MLRGSSAGQNERGLVKINNLVELYSILPEDEKLIVDVLRQIIREALPDYCKEKISYNVPFFYGNKGICIVWPSTIPRGGIKKGVLLGFWYGNRLHDKDQFLTHGTNKQIFYKIYEAVAEVDERPIKKLLKEAVKLDGARKNTAGTEEWVRRVVAASLEDNSG
jgi:hypothetical protein